MTPHFADRVEAAVGQSAGPICVGLDPHLALLPPEFAAAHDAGATRAERAAAVEAFLFAAIDALAGVAGVVKPQSAFFEALGADGARVWESVVGRCHDAGLLVIGDVKRGDIGSTAQAYVHAHLGGSGVDDPRTLCDAATLNAFLGSDSMQPWLEACKDSGKGLFVLVRTSNPSSAEFQAQGEPSLSERLADAVESWGAELRGTGGLSAVGAVVGATHPAELARMRARMPHTLFLLPGFGAQGAGASDVTGGFLPGGRGALVSSSRGVLFAKPAAERGGDWRDAIRAAAGEMAGSLRAALAAH